MKKFLSILLAVMMILSTVSFAAPSLAGSADTAVEAPVAEAPVVDEEVAELAAVAGDESTYGKLIFKVDFENFEVGEVLLDHQYLEQILDADDYDPAFGNENYYMNWEVGANTIVEANGNKFIRGGQGYSQIRVENIKYGHGAPDGVYTYVLDVIDFGSAQRGVAATTQDCWVQQEPVNSGIKPTVLVGWEGKLGEWQTIAAEWDGVSNNMSWYFTDAATTEVGFDNLKVYYRPNTVKLTIAGEEYEVSTNEPITAASLASKVNAPTGYILSGLSLTEGGELLTGEQYFFEDTTLYPTYAKDPYMSELYGKALLVIDFEREDMQNWTGHSQDVENSVVMNGAQVYTTASYYDPRFENKNFRVRFKVNEDNSTTDQKIVSDASGNHYTEGTNETKWPQLYMTNWGDVRGDAGIYTVVVDTKTSAAPESFTVRGGWTRVDTNGAPSAEWTTVAIQQTLATDNSLIPNVADGNLYYAFGAVNASKVAFDNFYLYYKPLTADVTLVYKGEEYLAEDVSTAGVSTATILEAAGLEVPYGKKAVLSATADGESVGSIVNLVEDSKFYVSFEDDDTLSEYGQRLFLIDFEQFDVNTYFQVSNTVRGLTSEYVPEVADAGINLYVDADSTGKLGGTIFAEGGNKYVGSTVGRGWGQFGIKNIKDKFGKDGYYTVVADAYATTARTMSMANNTEHVQANVLDPWCGEANKWDTVVSEYSAPQNEMLTWFTDGDASNPIRFDNIALYYRPASVNLTVVGIDGEETVYEDTASVVDVDAILADVTAPFGYKAALSIEKDGEPLTGTINLVSDAKLYVVLVEDDKVHLEYGEALVIVDLEREDAIGWWGMSQDVANSTDQHGAYVEEVASYYDSRFEGVNFRIRFISNESPRVDQVMAVDANGNHYITGSNTTQWSQVTNSNFGNVQGEAGTYTYMFDVMLGEGSESKVIGSPKTMIQANTGAIGVWETVISQTVLEADGNMPSGTWANFNFSATNVATVCFDNAYIYFKPFKADVDLLANGVVVATKTDVDTAGVLVSTLVDGVKVQGYNVTGVKLGEKVYGLDETVAVPCDCQLELALEVKEGADVAPETSNEVSLRNDDPMGIRFKASLKSSELENITDYGWVVTRKKLLVDDAELTLDWTGKKVTGYGRQNGTDLKDFFGEDAENKIFTAVLYFSETEDDGLPSAEKLGELLVARPFVKVDGEVYYGDAVEKSIFDYINDAYNENGELWNGFSYEVQEYYISILDKVDPEASGVNPFI
ncbi:MAG: hypothetical protein E7600_01715 [Ruminococcaceae bacterium]|nr:hypothetical protein [Oscillospiraceae bacterium]